MKGYIFFARRIQESFKKAGGYNNIYVDEDGANKPERRGESKKTNNINIYI